MLIRGQEVKEGPKQLPANPKMYNMIRAQAKSRFSKQSPASAHFIHAKYVQMGGKFVTSKKDIDPRFRDYAEEEKKKKEKSMLKKVTKPVGKGSIAGESITRQF
jgi:hypothetical protein